MALSLIGQALALGHRGLRQKFTLEHPNLHAAGAIRGLRGGTGEVDIGAQGMQRHAALAIPFHAGDFRTAQTAAAVDADAAGAQTHRRLDGALHGTTERDAALELLGDVLGHQLGVEFRLANFDDVQMHFRLGHLGQIGTQLLDVGALLADHHARTCRVDGDAGLLGRPLDHDAGDAGLGQALLEVFTDLQILVQQIGILLVIREPARIPGAIDAETEPDRIDFLTHYACSPLCCASAGFDFAVLPFAFGAGAFFSSSRSRTTMVRWLNGFKILAPRPRARAWKRRITRPLPTLASATTRRSTSS